MPDGRHGASRGQPDSSDEARRRALANEERLKALGDAVDQRNGHHRRQRGHVAPRAASAPAPVAGRPGSPSSCSSVCCWAAAISTPSTGSTRSPRSTVRGITYPDAEPALQHPGRRLGLRAGLSGQVAKATGASSGRSAASAATWSRSSTSTRSSGTIIDRLDPARHGRHAARQPEPLRPVQPDQRELRQRPVAAGPDDHRQLRHPDQPRGPGELRRADQRRRRHRRGLPRLPLPQPRPRLRAQHPPPRLPAGERLPGPRGRAEPPLLLLADRHGRGPRTATHWSLRATTRRAGTTTAPATSAASTARTRSCARCSTASRATWATRSRINGFFSSIPQGVTIDNTWSLNELIGLALKFHSLNSSADPHLHAADGRRDPGRGRRPVRPAALRPAAPGQRLRDRADGADEPAAQPGRPDADAAPRHRDDPVDGDDHDGRRAPPRAPTTTTTNPTLAVPPFDPVPCAPK